MANQATTTYKVTGTRKAVSDLWNTLQSMNVNTKNIWLDDLAKFYGASTTRQSISVSVVTSIGLSMKRTRRMTTSLSHSLLNLPGMLVMTCLRR